MKYKNTGDDITLRGVEFPKGKAVEVENASLAAKVAAMPQFEAVTRKPKNDKKPS